ncbi:hypothetical protein ACFRCW_26020 [Streptomyces sp. NPDC056653]|uniref:hypothetical protein n=1 Tax=Streptomyces sp. NPDC056653 TaxID=3345894 RepID=UPI003687F7EF
MARPSRLPRLGACAVTAATLALAGCTSGGVSSSPATTPPTSGPTASAPGSGPPTPATPRSPGTPPPTTTAGSPGTVSLSFSDNGKPVHLTVGERLHIALDSPYWTFHQSDAPRVLRQDATGVARPTASCSGPTRTAGCGTSTADFTAVGAGRTSVVATRRVCGEAMRCTGSRGRFVVYAVVG